MTHSPRTVQRLTDLRLALENLSRQTTVSRPLSPLYLKEMLDAHAGELAAVLVEMAQPAGPMALPSPPRETEPKKGSKPPDGKPV